MIRAPLRLLRVSRAVTFGPLPRPSFFDYGTAPSGQANASLRVLDQPVSSRSQGQIAALVLRRTALPAVAAGSSSSASSASSGATGLAMASAVASLVSPAARPLGSIGDLRSFPFICSFVPLGSDELDTLSSAAESSKTIPHSHPAPPGLFSSYTPRAPLDVASGAANDHSAGGEGPTPPPALLVDTHSLTVATASASLSPSAGESGWARLSAAYSSAGPRSLKAGLTQFLLRTHPDFVASVEIAAAEEHAAAEAEAAAAAAAAGGDEAGPSVHSPSPVLPTPDAVSGTNAQSLSRLLSFLEAAKDARTRAETVALEFFVRVHCYKNPFQKYSAATQVAKADAADEKTEKHLAQRPQQQQQQQQQSGGEVEGAEEEEGCDRSGEDAMSRAAHRREHGAMIEAALRRLALPLPSHTSQSTEPASGQNGTYRARRIEYRWAESPPPPPSPVFPFILVRAELRGRPLRRPSLVVAAAERRGRGKIDPQDHAARAEIRRVLATLLADAGVHVPQSVGEGIDPLAGLGFGGMASD